MDAEGTAQGEIVTVASLLRAAREDFAGCPTRTIFIYGAELDRQMAQYGIAIRTRLRRLPAGNPCRTDPS